MSGLPRCKADTYVFNLLNGFSVAHDYRGSDKKCSNCDYGKSDTDLPMYPFKQSLPGNVTALQMVESMVQGMYPFKKPLPGSVMAPMPI